MTDYIQNIKDGERRFFAQPVDFEKREDGVNENVIEGYAAVFNKDSQDFGGWVERIAPDSFTEVLNDDAVALFNHEDNLILGRNKVNVTITQDAIGLKYSIKLPDTTLAKDIRQLVKDKIIHQSSFAFTVSTQEWEHNKDKPSVRTIKKIKRLYDVSPVTRPAYIDSTVAARAFSEEKKPETYPIDTMELKLIINKHI